MPEDELVVAAAEAAAAAVNAEVERKRAVEREGEDVEVVWWK